MVPGPPRMPRLQRGPGPGGLPHPPLRQGRGLEHCYECPDLLPCDKFALLLAEFPDVKTRLRRRQVKFMAQEYHRKLEIT